MVCKIEEANPTIFNKILFDEAILFKIVVQTDRRRRICNALSNNVSYVEIIQKLDAKDENQKPPHK